MNFMGERLRELREREGYSYRELSKFVNISAAYLCDMEKGRRTNPSIHLLYRLSSFYKVPLEYFLVSWQ